jgi:hypothetical protein
VERIRLAAAGSAIWATAIVHAAGWPQLPPPLPGPPLPGAAGPRLELVAEAPHDLEIVDVFVYALPEQAASGAPRPNRFASGVSELTLDIRVKALRRMGTVIRFDVRTTSGEVAIADGLFSFARLEKEGVSSMQLDLLPKIGVFADGPYQLTVYMNEIRVAVLNWTVGR